MEGRKQQERRKEMRERRMEEGEREGEMKERGSLARGRVESREKRMEKYPYQFFLVTRIYLKPDFSVFSVV